MSASAPSVGQQRRSPEQGHARGPIAHIKSETSTPSARRSHKLFATPRESPSMVFQRSPEHHQPSQMSALPLFPVDFKDLNPEAQRRYLISVCRTVAENGPVAASDRATYQKDPSTQTLDSLFATLHTTAEAIVLLTQNTRDTKSE
ncbi:hypothetical protein GQ607_011773 [Colletotrichum asianum]|uniref:Uncharacterized protein n=1 Tax=Colletotrichum asianum TaxID=702518 RepID=A0A8H3W708_9PEZI|nr:hypothetical protein GQ607_011773 [Colletotrichum asianum]